MSVRIRITPLSVRLVRVSYKTNSDIYEISSMMVVRFAGCSLL